MNSINRIISAAGRVILPSLLWKVDSDEKNIYLTFDDGPIPEITPWVLSLLKKYQAKATFFCIGDNVSKFPDIFKQVIFEGHRVGNHSYHHLNGWSTSSDRYLKNILLAEEAMVKFSHAPSVYPAVFKNNLRSSVSRSSQQSAILTPTSPEISSHKGQFTTGSWDKIFRPPFGKITPLQIKKLEKNNFKIVMWDVISEDYDQTKTPEYCYKTVINHSKPGSILVFHDSIKAFPNLQSILPKVLKYYSEKNYKFKTL